MIILSAFFFACMNVSVRLAGDLPSVQKSFFRNLVAAVFAAIILTRKHMVPRVQKQYWGPLFLRCAFGTLGILCNFYAIDHLLVADASILNKLSPFFAIIFSFLLLKGSHLIIGASQILDDGFHRCSITNLCFFPFDLCQFGGKIILAMTKIGI